MSAIGIAATVIFWLNQRVLSLGQSAHWLGWDGGPTGSGVLT